MRIVAALALVALATAPAFAGVPYAPPVLSPGGRATPPADLLAAVAVLQKAIEARDVAGVAPFIGADINVLNGAIDMHIKRKVEAIGPWKDARAALISLGENTGGDWYVPDGADPGDVLVENALEYWGWMLEGEVEWGFDPLAPGAICTYEDFAFDADELARVGEAVGTASSSFVMVDEPTPVLSLPDLASTAATLQPGLLYALDYDTDTPYEGIAVHLPEGGVAYITFPDEGMLKPYDAGICFAKSAAGTWQVVAQANTTL